MKFLALFFFLLFVFPLWAKVEVPFEPWYSDPLIANTAENNAPGEISINPYIYVTHKNSYARRASTNLLEGFLWLQAGVTNWLDMTLLGSYQGKWSGGQHSTGLGDTNVLFGFQIVTEDYQTPQPSIRFILQECFPTGKYDSLDRKKRFTDAHGKGAYQTQVVFAIDKVFFWLKNHPIKPVLNLSVNLPSKVHVHGYNAYGGGKGTHGTVSPGLTLSGDLGCEFSFTQKFVATMEMFTSRQWKTTFSGKKGVLSNGKNASNKVGFNRQFTLAPGLEYNFKKDCFILAGAWFSTSEKNIPRFVTGIISMQYTF